MELRVDPMRSLELAPEPELLATGIYVRALRDGRWGNADIFELDTLSLREWVRSRGEVSEWAMSVIEHLLLHDRSVKATCGTHNPRTGMVCDIPPHEDRKHWKTGVDGQRYDWYVEA